MNGKGWLLLAIGGMLAGLILAGGCGGDGDQAGAKGDTAAASPTAESAVTREMMKSMILGAGDLPGFVISDARFLDNAGASENAPDPAASQTSLEKMGRIVGFHAIFNSFGKTSPGAPSAILWSVNLFQQPSGALDFMGQPPEEAQGFTQEPIGVSTLGPDAVGWAFRSSVPDKAASGYSVAFADGVIQVTLTTLYNDEQAPADYTLNLAQQARTLVQTGLGSQPAQPSPQADGAASGSPTTTPHAGIAAPAQAGAALSASPTGTPAGITASTHLCVGMDCP